MYVKQNKDTFIRIYDNYGYIMSQLTYLDRIYNETGADFLKQISRKVQKIENIVNDLKLIYGNSIDYQELKRDFEQFVFELEKFMFVTTGNSPEEIEYKEPSFSYQKNPKTNLRKFLQTFSEYEVDDSSEFLLKNSVKNPQLSSVELEITSRCNERCVHCYVPTKRKDTGGDIPLHIVYKALDEAKLLNILEVSISGGEPLLHKGLSDILDYAFRKDFKISILSNLVALTNEHIKLFKKYNVGLVQVSLYSMKAEEHDEITKLSGSFTKTKSNIEKLIASDIPVQISCPTMKGNYHSYKDVLMYAEKMLTKSYTDFALMAQSDFNIENLETRLTDEQIVDVIKDIIKYDKQYTNDILCQPRKSENLAEFSESPLCGVGLGMICVGYDGDVYPCAGWQGYVLGNLTNESLVEIWNNSKRLQKLRAIKMKDFPECISCDAKDYCAICLVRNFNENRGDMFKISESNCRAAKLNKQVVEDFKK